MRINPGSFYADFAGKGSVGSELNSAVGAKLACIAQELHILLCGLGTKAELVGGNLQAVSHCAEFICGVMERRCLSELLNVGASGASSRDVEHQPGALPPQELAAIGAPANSFRETFVGFARWLSK